MHTTTSHPVCPTSLSAAQLAQFERDGFLAFTDVLSGREVGQGVRELSALVEQARTSPSYELRSGKYLHSTASRFFVQIESSVQDANVLQLSAIDFEMKVRKLMNFCEADQFLNALAQHHPRIRGVIESILGADPILLQDMALVKPPFIGVEKPWHQDDAYFSVTPLEAVVGVWIALDEAKIENGCMHVLAGEHKRGPRKHHHDRDCEIVPDRLDPSRAVPVELPAGGAMFFSGLLPHQTPPNSSPLRRRALQFHYRSVSSRIVPREEYDRVYAEADGTPASCAAAVPKK